MGVQDLQCGWLGAANVKEAHDRMPELHRRHYATMRGLVPPEQLLDFRLDDGWDPLCKFLGVPVPDESFPHVNESSALLKFRNDIFWDILKRLGRRLSVLSILTSVLVAAYKGHFWEIVPFQWLRGFLYQR